MNTKELMAYNKGLRSAQDINGLIDALRAIQLVHGNLPVVAIHAPYRRRTVTPNLSFSSVNDVREPVSRMGQLVVLL